MRQLSRFLMICLLVGLLWPCLQAMPASAQGLPELPSESLLTDPVFARRGFAGLANLYANRTRYLLAINVDNQRGRLEGKARVIFVNTAGVALDEVVFRLYPNHPTHGGRQMRINTLSVNGQVTEGQFRDNAQTVFAVPLSAPINSGGSAVFEFDYTITVPAGASFYYVSEPFPMVSVYDPSLGWRQEVATNGLDYAFSESALFAVNLRAPTNMGTWFVGAIKSAQESPDGTTTYTIVTGPVRNFLVLQARGWGVIDVPGAAVPIRVLYSGSASVAQEVANIAVAAFNFFDTQISPYPYAEFDIVVMRFPSGGEEYPWMVFINNERDSAYRRFITAHEVAHQWFYGIAGNDTMRNAWLDESLVQVASYLFYQQTGYASADEFWTFVMRWGSRYTGAKLIDTPLDQFASFEEYMSTTYGGGAVFLRQVAEQIGVPQFLAGLRVYTQTVNLGIGTPVQFFNAIQGQTSQNLRPLFCQRVGIMC